MSNVDAREEQPDPLHAEARSQRGGEALGDAHDFIGDVRRKIVVVREVLARNDQHVALAYGVDVEKGDQGLALVDEARRHFTLGDAAEQAVCVGHGDREGVDRIVGPHRIG